ncbi:MAG: hypothetical protein HKN04_04590 [Rhodothermaceae bacterium]|nr:hypothetical protein [Rhodothermaceae bacterium]
MVNLSDNATTRSLLEVALGFLGAMLILPLLFRAVTGVFTGLFRFRPTRRLIGEAVFAGLTALLTREGVLDALFGEKGETGDGLLKPRIDD